MAREASGPRPIGPVQWRDAAAEHESVPPHGERTTGPEHEQLRVFIGEWKVEGRNAPAAPGAPGEPVEGRVTYEWLPGGFFVVSRWDRRFGADLQRHTGLGVIGHEPDEPAYFAQVFDNLGFARRYRVELDGRVWRFVGRWERAQLTFEADGRSFSERWEIARDRSGWQPLCELTAQKLG